MDVHKSLLLGGFFFPNLNLISPSPSFLFLRLPVILSIIVWSEDAAKQSELTVLILMLLFFFLLSFKYLCSFLSELGPTQGNEFLYEVKCEISGTELLMQFSLASTIAFPL